MDNNGQIEEIKLRLLDFQNIKHDDMRMRRTEGLDWPLAAETMIGLKRMNNIKFCLEDVLKNNIEGDVLEAGVWRGGACIFMKFILNHHNSTKRVFVCDSFRGLPPPECPQDKDSLLHTYHQLSASLEEVTNNFKKYNVLDDRVVFIRGWFKDTLPLLKEQKVKFSVIRLDGDLYKSTMDQLENLYDGLSVGGYCIIDDWTIPAVRLACDEFRASNNITSEVMIIDQLGAYWKK